MDKTSVEAAVSVEAVGSTTVLTSTAELQDDKKTVIVTLDNANLMKNKKGYDVKVAATAETVKGETLEKAYVYTFQFNDTVAPTVKSITIQEDGKLIVEFSEVVKNDAVFSLNGQTVTGTHDVTNNAKYSITVPASVKAGDTVNLIVSQATDIADPANKMSIYTTSFKYDYAVNAPKVAKLAAKDEETIELDFSKKVVVPVKNTEVKVFLAGVELVAADYNVNVVANSNDTKYTVDFTAAGLAKLYANNATEATVKVVVEQYKDTLQPANMGTKVEQNIVMKKDTVKPALKGSLVYKAANQTLTANLSKKVAATTALENDIYVLDTATGVRYPVSVNATAQDGLLTLAAQLNASDERIVLNNGTVADPALANGTYQLVIEAGAVEDQAFGKNKNDKIVSTFTVTGAVSTVKPVPTVTSGFGADNKTLTVKYDIAVDITATNIANYKLNGKALPTGTVITLDADKKIATIKLPEGSFEKTENQVLTIENVKSVDGVTMDKHEEVFKVIDNAQPKLTGASLVDGDIILTFSENVDTTTVTGGTAFVDSDFKIVLNGATLTATTNYTVVDKTSASGDSSLKENQVKISPVAATGINFTTASTLTVEIDENAGMEDAESNAVVKGPQTKITIK